MDRSMTFGEAVMRVLSDWDRFIEDADHFDSLEDSMECLRQLSGGLIDAHVKPHVIFPKAELGGIVDGS